MLDEISVLVEHLSLLTLVNGSSDKSLDRQKNSYKNAMLQKGFIFHFQTRLSEHLRSPMFPWPNYSLRKDVTNEPC